VGADALLQELEAALVLRDLQQLHGATLVGGKSGMKLSITSWLINKPSGLKAMVI
jgi:hypothetical protein